MCINVLTSSTMTQDCSSSLDLLANERTLVKSLGRAGQPNKVTDHFCWEGEYIE